MKIDRNPQSVLYASSWILEYTKRDIRNIFLDPKELRHLNFRASIGYAINWYRKLLL